MTRRCRATPWFLDDLGFDWRKPGCGHGGGAPGMNAILCVYPKSGRSVIVLCNLDSPSASRPGDWLHPRIPLK